MIEAGIVSLLNSASAITSLCVGRIYPVTAPDTGEFPCLVYQLVSSIPQYSMDGPTGFIRARVQFDAWAAAYSDAKALAEALRVTLDGFTGKLPDGTLVLNTLIDSGLDYYDKYSRLYRVSADYRFLYSLQ